MEGQMSATRLGRLRFIIFALPVLTLAGASAFAQESAPAGGQAEISLRKTIQTKKYQGKDVEGEERLIGRGDSLWRILVEEKGVPGQRFQSYIVVIRGLNPQLKNLDVLRIGDKIFIPLRPDQVLEARSPSEAGSTERGAPGSGVTTQYRVKAGEHLYQILREQLKLTDDRTVGQYYALVKDLNPERKNWDTLLEGEIIRLLTTGQVKKTWRRPATLTRPSRGAEGVASLGAKSAGELRSVPGARTGDQWATATKSAPEVNAVA
jgi:hypothetical protein